MPGPPRVLRHLALSAGAALLVAGCAQTFDATRLGVPVTMASAAETPAQGTAFHLRKHAVFGLWGLFAFANPSLERMAGGQLLGGKGVADLRIRVHSTWKDLLFTVLTAGVVVPRSVEFDGVILDSTSVTPAAADSLP